MPLVAGFDSSTQSCKVEVRDADDGRLWGTGRDNHPATTPPVSEQDPAAWWSSMIQAFHQTTRYAIEAMSVAAQQHGLVALDSEGASVHPGKLWNDTESAPQARALVDGLGAPSWADAVGSVPTAAFTISKLAWLRDANPTAFASTSHVLLPHDWLTYRLTGRFVTDRGDASGTGYWSPAEGRWRADILALIDADRDWADALPLVLSPFEAAGTVATVARRPLNLATSDVVVAAGTGDNMAAALGIGLMPGDLVVSIGTSGTVFAVSDRPVADPTGAVSGFADATGRFLPLVCTSNATKVTDAFARLLGVELGAFDALALSAPPGARGVVLLPYLDGERTPNRPDATGTLAGLRSDVDAADVARAAVEGVVCGLLDGLDALAAVDVPTAGRLFLVGGGARSAAYRQVLADLAGRAVTVPNPVAEHVATGACVQAAAALTGAGFEEIAKAWALGGGDVIEPDLRVDRDAVRAAYASVRG